tara:strand:+ start:189 stop:440 length:252 start_codon:yes stop_codon:yes gene_type:complete
MIVPERPYKSNALSIYEHLLRKGRNHVKGKVFLKVGNELREMGINQKIIKGGWQHLYWVKSRCAIPVRKVKTGVYEVCTYEQN